MGMGLINVLAGNVHLAEMGDARKITIPFLHSFSVHAQHISEVATFLLRLKLPLGPMIP